MSHLEGRFLAQAYVMSQHLEQQAYALSQTGPDGPRLLTVADVARRLGLHRQTVRRFIRTGVLPAVRLSPGPRAPFRVPADALEAWIYGRPDEDGA